MQATSVLIDGHVHIYDQKKCGALLNAASRNFEKLASAEGLRPACGVLFLADPSHVDGFGWFSRINNDPVSCCANGWTITAAPDANTLHLHHPDRLPLVIISGHQAISAENLEVLIFPKVALPETRQSLEKTIALATSQNALAVLPWGAGKWTGARGKKVAEVIEQNQTGMLCVGDNGGRSRLPWRINLLERASQRGLPCLSGTDPLPLANEEGRIGAFGGYIGEALDQTATAADIIEWVTGKPIRPFGHLLPLHKFIANQIALRLS